MDWFKVKVSYCLYTDLNDKQFGAYIKLMALTAQIEGIPTQQQMLKVCHYKTLNTLQDYFNTRSTDLQDVLNKVLIDVQGVVNSRAASKARMQQFRGSKAHVTPNVTQTERKREEKRREEKRVTKKDTFSVLFLLSKHQAEEYKSLLLDFIAMRKEIKAKMKANNHSLLF